MGLQFMSGGRPEEGLVMGALLVAVAVGSMPLVFKFFNTTPGPPRVLALVGAAGLLLMLLRPPLPLRVRPHTIPPAGPPCTSTSRDCCETQFGDLRWTALGNRERTTCAVMPYRCRFVPSPCCGIDVRARCYVMWQGRGPQGGAKCPKLPLALCPRLWDETHIPARDEEDAAIYGSGLARRHNWPTSAPCRCLLPPTLTITTLSHWQSGELHK